jgi:hypothetical protein
VKERNFLTVSGGSGQTGDYVLPSCISFFLFYVSHFYFFSLLLTHSLTLFSSYDIALSLWLSTESQFFQPLYVCLYIFIPHISISIHSLFFQFSDYTSTSMTMRLNVNLQLSDADAGSSWFSRFTFSFFEK